MYVYIFKLYSIISNLYVSKSLLNLRKNHALEQVSQNLGMSFLLIYPTKFNQILGGESIRVYDQILDVPLLWERRKIVEALE